MRRTPLPVSLPKIILSGHSTTAHRGGGGGGAGGDMN